MRATVLVALGVLSALIGAGCGGGSDEGSSEAAARRHVETTGGGRTAKGSPAVNQAPPGSSPVRARNLPAVPTPRTGSTREGAAAAIRAGERACAGKSPTEVKETYYPQTVESGNLDPESPEAEAIEEVDEYEARVTTEVSFTAGQLAAGAYERTLPDEVASSGYQGCVYALSKWLERMVR